MSLAILTLWQDGEQTAAGKRVSVPKATLGHIGRGGEESDHDVQHERKGREDDRGRHAEYRET